jgi:uncharacterized membrane protein
MKLAIAAGVVLLIIVSLIADYKWKRWIAARKQEHENSGDHKA